MKFSAKGFTRRAAFAAALLVIATVSIGCHETEADYHGDVHYGYLSWSGNYHSDYVVDVDDDFFRFRYSDGALEFGHTVYPHVYVNEDGYFIWGDVLVGQVSLIHYDAGHYVAALVDLDGYLLDIYGPERDLHWATTNVRAI